MKLSPPKDLNLIARNLFQFSLLTLLCLSCMPQGLKEEPTPDYFLPQDSMVDLMYDIHLLEGARIGNETIGDSLPIRAHYENVWSKHGITKARYDSNFLYYSRNAERMNTVYEQVLEKLSRLESTVEADNDADVQQSDSTRAAPDPD